MATATIIVEGRNAGKERSLQLVRGRLQIRGTSGNGCGNGLGHTQAAEGEQKMMMYVRHRHPCCESSSYCGRTIAPRPPDNTNGPADHRSAPARLNAGRLSARTPPAWRGQRPAVAWLGREIGHSKGRPATARTDRPQPKTTQTGRRDHRSAPARSNAGKLSAQSTGHEGRQRPAARLRVTASPPITTAARTPSPAISGQLTAGSAERKVDIVTAVDTSVVRLS